MIYIDFSPVLTAYEFESQPVAETHDIYDIEQNLVKYFYWQVVD